MDSGRLTIFGVASPYSWDVVEAATLRGWTVRAFDNYGGADASLPGLHSSSPDTGTAMTLGLSSAHGRAGAANAAFTAGFHTALSLIHPHSSIASTSELSHGCFVNAGVVIGSKTTVRCHVNLNRSSSIGHDNNIGFAASISPGATLAGGVTVGPLATVGTGAVVLPGRTIGRGAIVGAGAVVTHDVDEFTVVVGNPARALRVEATATEQLTCPHC